MHGYKDKVHSNALIASLEVDHDADALLSSLPGSVSAGAAGALASATTAIPSANVTSLSDQALVSAEWDATDVPSTPPLDDLPIDHSQAVTSPYKGNYAERYASTQRRLAVSLTDSYDDNYDMSDSEKTYWQATPAACELTRNFLQAHWAVPQNVIQAYTLRRVKEECLVRFGVLKADDIKKQPAVPSCISFVDVTVNGQACCFIALSGGTYEEVRQAHHRETQTVLEQLNATARQLNQRPDQHCNYIVVEQASNDYQKLMRNLAAAKNIKYEPKTCAELSFVSVLFKLAKMRGVNLSINGVINCQYYAYQKPADMKARYGFDAYHDAKNTQKILVSKSATKGKKQLALENNSATHNGATPIAGAAGALGTQNTTTAHTSNAAREKKYYHTVLLDCCGNCRALKPIVERLMKKAAKPGCLNEQPISPLRSHGVLLFTGRTTQSCVAEYSHGMTSACRALRFSDASLSADDAAAAVTSTSLTTTTTTTTTTLALPLPAVSASFAAPSTAAALLAARAACEADDSDDDDEAYYALQAAESAHARASEPQNQADAAAAQAVSEAQRPRGMVVS